MPSELSDPSQDLRQGKNRIKKARPLSSCAGAASAYSNVIGACLACGPEHALQIRELSRCGLRGEGYGAWCGSCRRVYALDAMGLEPAA